MNLFLRCTALEIVEALEIVSLVVYFASKNVSNITLNGTLPVAEPGGWSGGSGSRVRVPGLAT